MKPDAFYLRQFALQLRSLQGSRIQKIFQPRSNTLVFRLFPGFDQAPLVCRIDAKAKLYFGDPGLENPAQAPSFCMLLRKHLVGGFLVHAEQPSFDRHLAFDVETKDDDVLLRHRVVLEFFGPRANLHLLRQDKVLGSLHRFASDKDRFQKERSYQGLDSPEWFQKLERGELPSSEEIQAFRAKDRDALKGLSPTLRDLLRPRSEAEIREALGKLFGGPEPIPGPFLVARGRPSPEGGRGRGTVLIGWDPRSNLDPEAEFPFEIQSASDFPELTRQAFARQDRKERRERAQKECSRALERARVRIERQIGRNQDAQEECLRADEWRRKGELLKPYLGRIERGASQVEVQDYRVHPPETLVLSIDPRKSPRANLDRFFQKAKRLERKLPILEKKRRNLDQEMLHLEELEAAMQDPEQDPLDLKEELRQLGFFDGQTRADHREKKSKKSKKSKPTLRTFVSSDHYRILVGRNNKENDYLVRGAGKKGDLWLHVEGIQGAHVLIKRDGKAGEIPGQTLREAGQLAVHFSKLRFAPKGLVMMSDVSRVKKPPNSPPGLVTVPSYETLSVESDPGIVRRLQPLGRN